MILLSLLPACTQKVFIIFLFYFLLYTKTSLRCGRKGVYVKPEEWEEGKSWVTNFKLACLQGKVL